MKESGQQDLMDKRDSRIGEETGAELGWLEDPGVYRVGRLDAHSDHCYYEKKEDIRPDGGMPLKQSLNGKWLFSYAPNPGLRRADFYRRDYDCAGFDTICVPGHIQLQGYDRCQYINTMYPWDGHDELRPPRISAEYNPVGSYVRFFRLKENLKGKRIYLSFQGVETAFYVWVDGRFAGYAEDGFTPSEYDITGLLQEEEEEHRLAVEVYKRSSASWIEDQDFWRFSGIFREVSLYALPDIHVRDLRIEADAEPLEPGTPEAEGQAYGTVGRGSLLVTLKLDGVAGTGSEPAEEAFYADYNVRVSLSGDGQEIDLGEYPCAREVSFTARAGKVKLWSAEQPNLYTLTIEIVNQAGTAAEIVPYRIGFRRFELKDGLMCINGRRIVFKGINRHEFSAQRGRAVTEEEILWDILFMKRNNINAVRTSHYPNQSLWYRLCDEYGIYLIDEMNLESHGSWQKMGACDPGWNVPGDDPAWIGAALDRAVSMFERDKNHPSVLIWSCGNESYAGEALRQVSDYFHRVDSGRLVHYEGVFWNRKYDFISDMESRMYAKPEEIRDYLDKNRTGEGSGKPYISCEYMHAMGNSCGGLHLYTGLEREYPQYQGGFLWDYLDQALWRVNDQGERVLAYGGDFDDRATDYCFCTDGIVYADRTPSPKVQEVRQLYSNVKLLPDAEGVTIVNDSLFTSTADYELICQVLDNGRCVHSGKLRITVPPQTTGRAATDWGRRVTDEAGHEYTLQAALILAGDTPWAGKGHEITFGQCVLPMESALHGSARTGDGRQGDSLAAGSGPLRVVHGDVNIGIYGRDFGVMLSRTEGGIVSLRYHGEEYITRIPRATFWRAMTDNDKGAGVDHSCARWMTAGLFAKCCGFDLKEGTEGVEARFDWRAAIDADCVYSVSYRIRPEGTLTVTLDYPGCPGLPELPACGLEFKLKERYHQFRYYGYGPEENYCDRRHGARLGLFTTDAASNMSRYLIPQECGNRTGVRVLEVTDGQGRGLTFTCEGSPFECSVLPHSAYELENAMHREELAPPHYTWVRILAAQMGVGGDDSWGAPVHESFRIPSERPLKVSFTLGEAGQEGMRH